MRHVVNDNAWRHIHAVQWYNYLTTCDVTVTLMIKIDKTNVRKVIMFNNNNKYLLFITKK